MIIVKNRELLIPNNERYLGTTYDDNSTIRTFRIARFNEDGTDKAQLDFYLIFNYDDGYAPDASGVVKSVSDEYIVLEWDVSEAITEHAGCLFAWVRGFDYTGTIRWSSFPGVFYIEGSGTEPSNLSDLEERISEEDRLLRLAKLYKSQPMTAATVADMKDRERIYVYVGNEPGYTYGNWYFWDGSAWVSGGAYNSAVYQTDKTLTTTDVAADAKAVGDRLAAEASARTAETAARTSAVSALQSSIAAEAAARNSADTSIQRSVTAEAAARSNVDGALQNALNTESAARTAGDALLQDQINQLVAPSGEAPSADEVLAARVGADGYTYPSLGDAIRNQVTESDYALASINGGILFEMGTYSNSDGTTKQDSVSRIRTVCPIDVRKIQGVKFSDDYEMFSWCLDENMALLGNLWGWIPGGFLSCGLNPSVKYINFVVRLKSDASANLTSYLNSFRNTAKVITDADCADGIGGWIEGGTYNDSDGITELSNSARARFKAPLMAEYIDRIDIPDGFQIYVYHKAVDGTIVHRSGWLSQCPETPEIDAYTINSSVAGIYRVNAIFKKDDETTMTDGDIALLNSMAKIHLYDQSYKVDKFRAFEKVFRPYQRGKYSGSWRQRISVMHVSDPHLRYTGTIKRLDELVELANYLSDANNNMIPLDLFVDTGDITTGGPYFADKPDRILLQFDAHRASIAKLTIPAIGITGNHDENIVASSDISESWINKSQRWSHYYAGFTSPGIVWGHKNYEGYHYYDVTRDGATVRFICLDQLDHPNPSGDTVEYDVMALAVYSQAQIDWLCDVALNVPDNYGVVICNHYPFAPRLSGYSHEYAALNDGTFCQGWNMIPEIVQAWVNRASLTKTYAGSVGNRNITVDADFSGVGSGAMFVCYLCGHTHSKDAFIVQDANHNSFKQLMLVEDSNGQQGAALNETYKDEQSRMTNCAASVISIDMRQKKVFRTSYGAYQNASTSIVTPQVECYTFDPSNMGQTAISI